MSTGNYVVFQQPSGSVALGRRPRRTFAPSQSDTRQECPEKEMNAVAWSLDRPVTGVTVIYEAGQEAARHCDLDAWRAEFSDAERAVLLTAAVTHTYAELEALWAALGGRPRHRECVEQQLFVFVRPLTESSTVVLEGSLRQPANR